jgi:acyl transferase domain-containing protein/NAD(P)-dependent dehydrogenase (short-subunit alcohol dehydrogenase family)/acyl carrier protein
LSDGRSDIQTVLSLVERKEISARAGVELLKVLRAQTRPAAATDIAVVGMAGRFPDADGIDAFWANLRSGRDSVREVNAAAWDVPGHPFSLEDEPASLPPRLWGAFLRDIDAFDSLFFRVPPKQAIWMDPRQRLFLEEAWKALEHAGYSAERLRGQPCGVFVGCEGGGDHYATQFGPAEASSDQFLGSSNSVLASRISYFADLKGPAVTIDTACSSSLVAIHLACESLRAGSCAMALAGGIQLITSSRFFSLLRRLGVLSPTGKCRAFDVAADGFVPGEAVGLVVLKPLSQALLDHDTIHGVIKGSGINQDGKSGSITAPNPEAQSRLVLEVYDKFGIDASTIGLVEAHGTGTQLGDPIEIGALTHAFRRHTPARGACFLGSVKTNIGHTGAAAGVVGLIKALLSLRHATIPPTLNLSAPNRALDHESGPFRFNQEVEAWPAPAQGGPRRAAVSSFGHSGTNAHLVIEEAPERPASASAIHPRRSFHLITLSAKTDGALVRSIEELSGWLEHRQPDEAALADISHTLLIGRTHHARRCALVVSDLGELKVGLSRLLKERPAPLSVGPGSERLVTLANHGNSLIRNARAWADGAGDDHREDLQSLADLYTLGCDLSWSILSPPGNAAIVPLPTYPFEREKLWLSRPDQQRQPSSAATKSVDPASARRALVLQRQWHKIPAWPALPNALAGLSLILVNHETESAGRALIEAGGGRSILVRHGQALRTLTADEHEVDFRDAEQTASLAERLMAMVADIATLVDLSDVGAGPSEPALLCVGKIPLLQTLVRARARDGLQVLHFTCGLRSFGTDQTDLRGAGTAGLMKALGAEYRRVRARTLDLATLPDPTTLVQRVGELLAFAGGETELCERKGDYYAPRWERKYDAQMGILRGAAGFGLDPAKVVLISGGTGGVGGALALHLAQQGVSKLALLARRSLPPRAAWTTMSAANTDADTLERVHRVLEIERAGAQVTLHAGHLSDEPGLRGFLEQVRRNFGPIGAVIHCAGFALDYPPAFISRSTADIQRVLEPKVQGVMTLYRLLREEPLQLFALFSSVSSAVPALAAGQLDYAMANSFLDAFAEHHAARGDQTIRSLCWPLWQDVGLGKRPAGKMYRDLGFIPHTLEEGIALLGETLQLPPGAPLLPCLVDPGRFSADRLPLIETAEGTRVVTVVSDRSAAANPDDPATNRSEGLLQTLLAFFSRELGIPPERLAAQDDLGDLGVDSIVLADLVVKLEREIGTRLNPSIILEHPTIEGLADHLSAILPAAPRPAIVEAQVTDDPSPKPPRREASSVPRMTSQALGPGGCPRIAVVGIACRFPSSPNRDVFWNNLAAGRNCVVEAPANRWNVQALYSPQPSYGKTVGKWGGYVEGIERFDPAYFGIREEIAAQIDPAIRLFLECSVQAIRDAGRTERDVAKTKVGVFVGGRLGGYSTRIKQFFPDTIIGTGQNFIAAQVSHFLNLKGPSLVVDTACSSSLVSLHLASQSLATGECDAALAGGVDILLDEKMHLGLSEAKALSPDGRCWTFDQRANGFVPGEGCGVVVLKRLEQALAEGDRIYAVIEGSAINNDGRTMGMTTPNPEAQRAVIEAALARAGADAHDIGYVEAHGTGTLIGDPIELRALNQVFRKSTSEIGSCAVGSVKTNIGHLLSAAGVASFVKVALCLHHGKLVPTLNCDTPNPRFNFAESPFYPNREVKPWRPRGGRRLAGISSFGFGGTNAHFVVGDCLPSWQGTRSPLAPVEFAGKHHWLDRADAGDRAPELATAVPPSLGNGHFAKKETNGARAPLLRFRQ